MFQQHRDLSSSLNRPHGNNYHPDFVTKYRRVTTTVFRRTHRVTLASNDIRLSLFVYLLSKYIKFILCLFRYLCFFIFFFFVSSGGLCFLSAALLASLRRHVPSGVHYIFISGPFCYLAVSQYCCSTIRHSR